jgi:hypothetical protein
MSFEEILQPANLVGKSVEQVQAELAAIGATIPASQLEEVINNAQLNLDGITRPARRSRYRAKRHEPVERDNRRYGYTRERNKVMAEVPSAKPNVGQPTPIIHENAGLRAGGEVLTPAETIVVAPLPVAPPDIKSVPQPVQTFTPADLPQAGLNFDKPMAAMPVMPPVDAPQPIVVAEGVTYDRDDINDAIPTEEDYSTEAADEVEEELHEEREQLIQATGAALDQVQDMRVHGVDNNGEGTTPLFRTL